MNTRTIIAAALLGTASLAGGIAATAASDTGAVRRAASQARTAAKALDKHKAVKAIAAAEAAVSLDPRNAGYRTLLGKAYLAAGRFPSAVTALGDALSLDPADGAAALHLALAQVATGDWSGARATLGSHDSTIAASDRGLALALAGDPASAVAVLTTAAREPGADAKTRQNLALSLALAGRWNEAKTVAAIDMAPAEVDARIMQWAAFAKPTGAADQVASLLGVVPIVDGGQPERLALNTTAPSVAAVAQPAAPVETFMPTQAAAPAVAAAPVVAPAPDAGKVDVANIGSAAIVAPAKEIVQPIPVATPVRTAAAAPVRTVAVPPLRAASVRGVVRTSAVVHTPVAVRPLAKGNFYVQLGAYDSAGVAKDAWGRMSRRVGALGRHAPQGMKINARGRDFYRLSVGGFARGDADTLCHRIRAGGAKCFVRIGAGDQIAAWTKPKGVQLAAR